MKKEPTPNSVIKGKVDKETAIRLLIQYDCSTITRISDRLEMTYKEAERIYEAAHDGDVLCEYMG